MVRFTKREVAESANNAAELARLRAENERLQRQLLSSTPGLRIHELEAENERLREKLARWEAIDFGRIDAVTDRDAEVERLRAELENITAAYRKIEDAPNEDIRKLAVAHMWTVLNEAFGSDKCR